MSNTSSQTTLPGAPSRANAGGDSRLDSFLLKDIG